jgi:hypothetical protein
VRWLGSGYLRTVTAVHATVVLAGNASAAAHVRALLRETLGPHLAAGCLDDAVLLASEMVDLALDGRERNLPHRIFRFTIDAEDGGVVSICVEGGEIDIRPGVQAHADALSLIAQLSRRWGVQQTPSPCIWAELPREVIPTVAL